MSELIQQIRDTIGIQDPITRIAAAGFLSVFTTFGILWVMQILIATGEGAITSKYVWKRLSVFLFVASLLFSRTTVNIYAR